MNYRYGMMKCSTEELDLQKLTENVSFLADCFDNSFSLQSTLNYVKDHVTNIEVKPASTSKRLASQTNKTCSQSAESNLKSNVSKGDVLSQIYSNNNSFKRHLKNWGLPPEISKKYEEKGITEMFEWQVDCLSNPKVLLENRNLLYSAPTSAGKTLVAEILTIKTVLERKKKVIIILPFVSIVREKMFYLQDILSSSGIRVEGFMGSQSPPGGLQAVHIAICTIEKANSLINKLLDEGNISELGAVVVDELHLLGDPHRGYILELLLTKIKYMSSKLYNMSIQIIGMSATLPNLEILANWLVAHLFVTEFRPIPLSECCLVEDKYYDKNGKDIGMLTKSKFKEIEGDKVLLLCLETIQDGCSILIFCMTKNRCENLAQSIASSFFKLGCMNNEHGLVLREQLKTQSILEVLEQLKSCPVGLDPVLKNIVSFGVAYHHAGLTFDERDIIEGAFKSGAVRVLVATSTLSSGVNLPARKVIIRSPVFQKQPINILTYKQMIGRAGRMGRDTKGESILICTQSEQKIGFDLMMGDLNPIKSCIESEDKFMRAILEMVASQDVCTEEELDLYAKCTLLFCQQEGTLSQNFLLKDTLKELINYELVRIQKDGSEVWYVATSLGKACLSSSMAPNDGLSLFCELQKARQCLVLETDLHLIYLVTPYSVSNQWSGIDWLHLLSLWENLTSAMKKVGELVGVQESFIICCLRGANKNNNNQNKLNIHKRFYTALALQDLVNEVPLSDVAGKFQCARGFLQGLQQASATFAGMVTAFCHQLGWKNMEMLISQFQDRLHFGIHLELLELMKLASLNGVRARTLFDAGFESITSIASADVNVIENTLYKSVPFQSEKQREEDDLNDIKKRKKIKNIWITGHCAMTAKEAAENLIKEARNYLEKEIGVTEIKWKNITSEQDTLNKNSMDIHKQNGHDKNTDKINISIKDTYITQQHITKMDEINNIEMVNNEVEMSDQLADRDINNKTNGLNADNTNKYNDVEINEVQRNTINNSNISSSVSVKEDIEWDSLNFTDNISKLPTSDFLSPKTTVACDSPVSAIFDNSTTKDIDVYKNISAKDLSLFSSDGDNSSLFEESFPSDFPNILRDNINDINKEVLVKGKDYSINSESMINAFKSVFDIDEDEDIKLVYEDEKKVSDSDIDLYVSQNEVINTQELNETFIKPHFISPFKRHAKTDKPYLAKRIKIQTKADKFCPIQGSSRSKEKILQFVIKVKTNKINCKVLKDEDIINNFIHILNAKRTSIIIDINPTSNTITNIGSDMFKSKKKLEGIKIEQLPFKGIALCLGNELCIYLDLITIGKYEKLFKSKLSEIVLNKNLDLLSIKSYYVHIKKYLAVNLSNCNDISLAEWLLDSDEKITTITDLTQKYCNMDLSNLVLHIDNQKKSYKSLNMHELSCLKAWCLWNIAAQQEKIIAEKTHFMEKTLNTEIQISKILGDCEYYGITVDKHLASRFLIDVKNSQEILQRKAFKICGYHFNFNSSKDVAKVLGMYKGRKISTKKSVLSAHNSPMSSIVIYWRKLNSILTKSLYPLTEQACIYSEANRISPSYTMYTCTGRITMHEPNLQNIPRTFSIPIQYLSDDNEPCSDVIEFNCRKIFKAASGYILVSADYCQLEMRILTHFSKDPVLTRIMSSDVDVFKSIAASWSGLKEDEVDDDLRQKAKQLCYGILYGMGNRTLAQHLNVTELEAGYFMDSFYKTFPAIKVFTASIVEECRRKGYVETLMKRRRYLPDINSNVPSKRSTAERQAVNTTVQGSAADIAKAAMCAIDNKTNSIAKPRLILQMHDELIYEVPNNMKIGFINKLKQLMEDTVRLDVLLPVKVKSGATWGTLEEIK